ncbi:unnamed protein product, partial [Rotaria sp. Silwood1]
HNKSCWSKSRPNKKAFCYVCYTYQATQLFSTKYCSSSVLHRVCDACIHQHIVSALDSCIVSSVTCPESSCCAILSLSAIRDILLKYNDHDLLNNYLREQNGKGKSEEWIQRFTLPCPGCNVPIQKNGGCNRMVCSRCKKCFYWTKLTMLGEDVNLTAWNMCFMTGFIIL